MMLKNKLLVLALFLLQLFNLHSQYPNDQFWYDNEGDLKNHFVLNEITFQLAKSSLLDCKTYHCNDYEQEHERITINTLDSLGKILNQTEGKFEIRVHTDCRGSKQSSIRLSEARAKSIIDYLITNHDMDKERLKAVGMEDIEPRIIKDGNITLACDYIISNSNKEQQEIYHQLNRRVEVVRIVQ